MELLLVLFWGGFLWYIAVTPKETMQMTWLILIGLILISPVFAMMSPAFR